MIQRVFKSFVFYIDLDNFGCKHWKDKHVKNCYKYENYF